jgi:hypothetical protein
LDALVSDIISVMAVHALEMGLMKTHVLERHLKCIDIFKPSIPDLFLK